MNPYPFQLVTRLGRWRPVCVFHKTVFSTRKQYEAHEERAMRRDEFCGGHLPFDQYSGLRGKGFRRVWWWHK